METIISNWNRPVNYRNDYTGLSYAQRETITTIRIFKEISSMVFTEGSYTPSVHCNVYEDKIGELDMAREYKYGLRTKSLNLKLHQFSDYVDWGGGSLSTISGLNTNQKIISLNHCTRKPMLSTGSRFRDVNIGTPHWEGMKEYIHVCMITYIYIYIRRENGYKNPFELWALFNNSSVSIWATPENSGSNINHTKIDEG